MRHWSLMLLTIGPAVIVPLCPRVALAEDVPGEERLSVEASGWVELNLLLLPDARPLEPRDVLTPAGFAMAADAPGRRRLSLSARDTRLQLGGRTPSPVGVLGAYVEYDLFGAGQSYQPRLRRAYFDWTSIDERWTARAGQDWSLFADPGSYAAVYNPLPLGAIFVRQPQLRIRRDLGDGLSLATSLESGRGDIAAMGGALPSALIKGPFDIALAVRLEGDWGALQLGGLARSRRAEEGRSGATGWGTSVSGRLHLRPGPQGSNLRFQATYGEGVSRYIGELGFGFERYFSDGVRAAPGDPGLDQVGAANVSYQKNLSARVSATVQVSYVHAGADGAASPAETATAGVGNVVFRPAPKIELAVEYMRAARRNAGAPPQVRSLLRLTSRMRF